MQVIIRNTSTRPLNSVFRVAFPASLTLPDRPVLKFAGGNRLPLFLEKSVGDITNIYTAKGTFQPGNTVGTLEGSDGSLHAGSNFILSPWTAKSPATSVPRILVTKSDGSVKQLWFGNRLSHVRGTPHIQAFENQSDVVDGWMCKQYLTAFSDLDHVDLKLRVNWADQSNPSYNTIIQRLRMVCSDEFRVYFADQMGLPNPTYDAMTDTWNLDLLTNQQIRDGQGIELRAFILTQPESFIGSTANDPDVIARLANLDAVRLGESRFGKVGALYAVYDDLNYNSNWFNEYLPDNFIPFEFRNNLIATPGIIGERVIGCTKTPGQSGSQQDFGADKGFEATVCRDPGWIAQAIAAQVDGMRTFNIHNVIGDRITKTTNPKRVTWNMETFDPLTQDTLGKTKWGWRDPGTGWNSYDTQHKSMNTALTYYALTGDELTLDILINALEADLQQARNLDLADREVGRTALYWSKMLRVLPANYSARLRQYVDIKIAELRQDWRGALLQTDPARTVRVQQVILDQRSGIVNPTTNKLEPSWICYQHAQMISGLYSLWLLTKDTTILPILKDLCNTYINYGVFKQAGVWYPIIFQRYRTGLESGVMISKNVLAPEEGLPLPIESFSLSSWEIKLDLGNNGWWDWVGPAIAVSRKLLDSPALKATATEILDQVYPSGFSNIESASWYPLSIEPV